MVVLWGGVVSYERGTPVGLYLLDQTRPAILCGKQVTSLGDCPGVRLQRPECIRHVGVRVKGLGFRVQG